jgi:hypothetical protein
MKAYVFLNPFLAANYGHVGWGFELNNGQFCYGSKETATALKIDKGCNNNVFVSYDSEANMLHQMNTKKTSFTYQYYKFIEIQNSNPDAAEAMAEDSKNWGYGLSGNNCMDDVFKIIKCYAHGNDTVLPWPATHLAPNAFFGAIETKQHKY